MVRYFQAGKGMSGSGLDAFVVCFIDLIVEAYSKFVILGIFIPTFLAGGSNEVFLEE